MRAVNLLPPVAPRRTSRVSGKQLLALAGVGVAVVAAVALVLVYTHARSDVRDRETALANLQAQIAALTPARRPLTPAEQQLASLQAPRISALNTALSNRIAWDLVLGHFAIVLPDDVWLTSLNAAKSSATSSLATTGPAALASGGACGGTGFCINGYTYSQPSVARVLSRLAVVPAFTNVTLSSSVETKLGTRSVYSFSIHADLTGQG